MRIATRLSDGLVEGNMETAERAEWRLYGKNVLGEARQPGDRFGRFIILDQISVSLLGILYEVKDTSTGDRLLLHLFPRGLARGDDFSIAMADLIRRQREISERAILGVRDAFTHDGVVGVVFNGFPGGGTLARRFEETSPARGLPPDEVKRILRKAARAMESMAAAGFHHFLLTAENVLINQSGDVRIFGFGWMEALSRRQFDAFVSGAILPFKREKSPPPGYSSVDAMSPEVRDQKPADARADIFSVGILGYFLLTHLRPVASWTLPSKADPAIPEGWDYLISHCLNGSLATRYPTWKAFLTELEQVEGLGKGPRPTSGVWKKLDRIPLPGGLTERVSARTQRIFRLILLGIFGCVVIGVGSMSYVVILTDSEMESGEVLPIVEADPGEPANLIIRTDPPDAVVRVLGGGGGVFRSEEGAVRLRGRFQEYAVRVEAPMYTSERFTIKLDPSEQVRSVSLDVAWGRVRVAGPAGARIVVVHEGGRRAYLDEIPEEGVWTSENRLLAQSYTLMVEQEGYAPAVFENIALGEKWTDLEAQLEPLPASLRVISNPSGVTVLLDGQEIGRTPLVYDTVEPLAEVLVTVTGEHLRLREQELTIAPGRENLVDFGDLEETTGTLFLTVRLEGRTPDEVEMAALRAEFGGRHYAGEAQINDSINSGSQTVTVGHPDYFPATEKIRIGDREAVSLTVDLSPRPGKLRLIIPDLPYRVTVDGAPADPVQKVVAIPPGNEVEVVLTVRDHQPIRRMIRHAPNQIEDWSPDLRRLEGPKPGDPWRPPYLNMAMAWIESGEYSMGSPAAEQMRLPNEDPRTRVQLSAGFWAATTEVTQETFRRIMGNDPSHFFGSDLPVDSVTWDEAVEFCERLTAVERRAGRLPDGYVYRLPSEAEWEYFARAGTRTPFHFGEAASPANGNFQGEYPRNHGNADLRTSEHYGAVTVGSYPPNAWGIHDVHGNVREWVYDGYNDRLAGGAVVDFVRVQEGRGRTYRGGSWEDSAHRSRSSARDPFSPGTRRPSIGFRAVLAREF